MIINRQDYTLGIKMGSNSMAYVAITKNTNEILDAGVRIFYDGREPKSKDPLNVKRRECRARRRNLKRRKSAQKHLRRLLAKTFKIPEKAMFECGNNPYIIRKNAAIKYVPQVMFCRAMLSLCGHRGFKSLRKCAGNDEISSMKEAGEFLKQHLIDHHITLGTYLANQQQKKFSPEIIDGKSKWTHYPIRSMVAYELRAIFSMQKTFHPELTPTLYNKLKKFIVEQRRLKPQERGKCGLENDEYRIYKASPVFQQFRIWENINNIMVKVAEDYEPLLIDEKKKLADALMNGGGWNRSGKLSFTKIRKILDLPKSTQINLDWKKQTTEKSDGLLADQTSVVFADPKRFGEKWFSFSMQQKDDIVKLLMDDSLFDDEIATTLARLFYDGEDVESERLDNIINAPLPEGTGSVSKKAIENTLPFIKKGYRFKDAAKMAGYEAQTVQDSKLLSKLPYYGEILPKSCMGGSGDVADSPEIRHGKVTNITVHKAMNILRGCVNKMISKYGRPTSIKIVMDKEFGMSQKRKAIYIKENLANKKINQTIEELAKKYNRISTPQIRLKYKLWLELGKNKLCIYSGKPIKEADVFSNNTEVDYILPLGKWYNDSRNNALICFQEMNRRKGNKTPYEAFGLMNAWPSIKERSKSLPEHKRMLFDEYNDTIENSLPNRAINDMRYESKLAYEYLQFVCKDVEGIKERAVYRFKKKWGLDGVFGEKEDHRKSVILAFTVACLSRNILISDDVFDLPHKDFSFKKFKERMLAIYTQHPPPAKEPLGAINEETNYGLIKDDDKKITLSVTKPAIDVEFKERKIDQILSVKHREAIMNIFVNSNSEKEFKNALLDYVKKTGIKRLKRKIPKSKDVIIKIEHENKEGQTFYRYCATGNNHLIYLTKSGESGTVSAFHYKTRNFFSKEDIAIILQKNDIVSFPNATHRYYRVSKINAGLATLKDVNDASPADSTNGFPIMGRDKVVIRKTQSIKKYLENGMIKKT